MCKKQCINKLSLLIELGSTKDPVYAFLSNANSQIEKIFQRKIKGNKKRREKMCKSKDIRL